MQWLFRSIYYNSILCRPANLKSCLYFIIRLWRHIFHFQTPSPLLDNIWVWAVMLIWGIRGKLSELFCAVLCNTIIVHTDMSSSYRWNILWLVFGSFLCFTRASLFVFGLVILCFVYFLFVTVSLSVPVQSIAGKIRLRNGLLCVERDVKPYTLIQSFTFRLSFSSNNCNNNSFPTVLF